VDDPGSLTYEELSRYFSRFCPVPRYALRKNGEMLIEGTLAGDVADGR
jgi:hypothetical protein